MTKQTDKIILASSSPYRQELLTRFKLSFTCCSPDIDESSFPGESPEQTVIRLSEAKARKVAETKTSALIIGSDQLVVSGKQVLAKPGTMEKAYSQLQTMRGKSSEFLTGLCVFNTETENIQLDCVVTKVYFRHYSDAEIQRYLEQEQPLNCAGSFKSELLGITLTERMEVSDPTALIGLPLIRLAYMLRNEGINLP